MIREYFNQQFSFYTTGLSNEKTKGQLRAFQASLNAYGYEEKSAPADWFEAFSRLKEFYNYKGTLGDEYMDYNLVMATNSFVGSNLR